MPRPSPPPTVDHAGARRRRRGTALLCSSVATLLAAPSAQGAFIGSAEDPAGDAPAPGLDITDAAFGYDRGSGRIAAGVRLRAAPSGDATIVIYAGTRTPTGCDRAPTLGFAHQTTSRHARWLRIDQADAVAASGYAKSEGYGTRTLQFAADDARLKDLRPDCVQVGVVAADAPTIHDALVLDLKPQPGLGLRLTSLPTSVRADRRRTLKVTISNPGDAPTGRVRVRLGALRGLRTSRRTVAVPSVAPGRQRTVRVGVTFSRRARTVNDLRVEAKAGALRAEAERRVIVRIPSRKPPSGGGGSGKGGGGGRPATCVQYFPDFSGDGGGSLGLVPCIR